MNEIEKQLFIANMLRKTNPKVLLNVGGSDIEGGYAAGGRLGLNVPMSEKSSLDVGVTGSSVKSGGYKKNQVHGADVTYRNGPHSFGASWNRSGQQVFANPENGFDPSISDPRFMLKYGYQF